MRLLILQDKFIIEFYMTFSETKSLYGFSFFVSAFNLDFLGGEC